MRSLDKYNNRTTAKLDLILSLVMLLMYVYRSPADYAPVVVVV